MTSQAGTSGAGPLYKHTAEGEQAAKEDVVIPHPDGDVVATLEEPPEGDSAGGKPSDQGPADGKNELPQPGDPADPVQRENNPGR